MKRIFDRIVAVLAGLALLLNGFALLDFLRHPLAGDYNFNLPLYRAAVILLFIPFTLLVGFLIVRRVRGNVAGLLLIVWSGSLAYTSLRETIHPSLFALYYFYDMVFGWLALFLLALHFPDGRIYPPRLARWIYPYLISSVSAPCLIFLTTRTLQVPARWPNPFYLPSLGWLPGPALGVAVLLFAPIIALALISPVLRYRRGSPLERLQLKWLALFAGLLALYSILFLILYRWLTGGEVMNPGNSPAALVFYLLVGPFPPLAIGIAVLRYRLWDIDIIIRRTLIYSTLTVVLTGIYFGSVVALQAAFTLLTGQASSVALVISTLGIAALFSPLRRSIQAAIDRRFYRRKVNAEQVLAAFSATLRDEVDQDHLVQATLQVVEECLHPAYLSLWLRQVDPPVRNER